MIYIKYMQISECVKKSSWVFLHPKKKKAVAEVNLAAKSKYTHGIHIVFVP